MILAGDVGGTKTYLGLFEMQGVRPQLVHGAAFRTQEYASLQAMLKDFLPAGTRVDAAAFGVAGPVVNGEVLLTNINWHLTTREMQSFLGAPVNLINDLVATGIGIGLLAEDKFLTLSEGEKQPGTIALIAAGTGLGESILYWNGQEHIVQPCEGGQAGFAPHDDIQIELLRFMRRTHPVVSVERVLSGPGMVSIYNFICEKHGVTEPEIEAAMQRESPASVIANAAADGSSKLAREAVDIFLSIYGSEAGNLALRAVSVGGVYVGGGIASRISLQLANGIFLKSFIEKDMMSEFMKKIPIRVILDDRAALFGAAQNAATHSITLELPSPKAKVS